MLIAPLARGSVTNVKRYLSRLLFAALQSGKRRSRAGG
jgi:hypothetical protein